MKKDMKKKLIQNLLIIFSIVSVAFSAEYFFTEQKAEAVTCEVSPCPCGKVYKKSAAMWSPGAKQDTVGSCVWPNQL